MAATDASTLPKKEIALDKERDLEHQPLSTNRSSRAQEDLIPLPPSIDEGPSPFVQDAVQRKHLQPSTIIYLDGSQHVFYTHKKADGEILFDMVANQLNLNEKDSFGLAFYDEQSVRHWLYKDKRISKQLKGLPWNFSFEVKFYPPHPSQLAEDLTRYLVCLQLRKDVYNERLPVSFVSQAKLGSLAAQSEYGDFDNTQGTQDYVGYLKNAKFAQVATDELLEKVQELHKQNKGLTPFDAELAYLEECKELAMYGVWLFPAKDNKGKPVQIGVSSHGISVYNDQMRLHRFAWVNIIKFSYRRNVFSIKLKPGELDKKDTVANYKLVDYPAAKRLWKCAVEHHTFFRLIQPETKPKSSFLGLGSNHFRYQGRTNIQSHMASQLFDSSVPTVERVNSGRTVSKSADDIAIKTLKHTSSPLHYADDGSKDLNSSPEKAYHLGKPLASSTAKKPSKRDSEEQKSKLVEGKQKKDKKAKKQKDDKKGDKKKKKKSGVDVSSESSSSSSSEGEMEITGGKGTQQSPHISTATSGSNSAVRLMQSSAGPYIPPANDNQDGKVIREEKVEQVYRIVGSGEQVPRVDPFDASLTGTLSHLTPKTTANVKMLDETVLLRENAPVPQTFKESSLPHTTTHTWHESTAQPETVTTEVDEYGNVVRRTIIKSEQVKHTVKTQSYQTYAVDENTAPVLSPVSSKSPPPPPQRSELQSSVFSNGSNKTDSASAVETHTRTMAYENGIRKQQEVNNGSSEAFQSSDLVSTKAVTTGNRTVETLTYKKEKDGVIETHVEHRITIHESPEIDHDAELSRAILEATNMNPEMTVEKVEVKQERH